MGMTFTGGMTMSGGMTALLGGGGGSWAVPNSASASSRLTISENTISANQDTSSGAFCIATGAKTLTGSFQYYSWEIVVNQRAVNPFFYTGLIDLAQFTDPNQFTQSPSSVGIGYGPGVGGVPRLWTWSAGGQGFFEPSIVVNNGDILGVAVEIRNNTGRNYYYLNGTPIEPENTFVNNFIGATSVALYTGWRATVPPASVTLRTDPSTFSFGGSYQNQNGWPA